MRPLVSLRARALWCCLVLVSGPLPAANLTPADREAFLERARRVEQLGRGFEHYMIGVSYLQGKEIEQDIPEAVRWFRLGAAMGDVYSQRNLVFAYHNGEGVAKDRVEALAWSLLVDGPDPKPDPDLTPSRAELLDGLTPAEIRQAGDRRKELAQIVAEGEKRALARFKALQREVAQDDFPRYFTMALKGDDYGQLRLGDMYAKGYEDLLTRDIAEACAWWMLAEAQGNRDAARQLAEARREQPAEVLARAKVRAEVLRTKVAPPPAKR